MIAIRGLLPMLLLFVVVGCQTARMTLAQELAWERWKKCDTFAGVSLKEIRSDGQIWVLYSGPNLAAWQECDRKAAQEQGSRRVGTSPPPAQATAGPSGPGAIAVPVWKVGSEWAYRYETPSGVGTFVWSMDRVEMLEGHPHYVIKVGTREIFYRVADLAFTQETADRKVIRQITPSDWRAVAFPVTIGKSWDMAYHEVRPEARETEDIRRTCTAEAEETVTVPAGSFSAVRVSCKNSRNGAWLLTVWFSPQVGHLVREESSVTGGKRVRELISYRLR